ncbi:membrane protein [Rubrobacter xylanophilus]|uniref:Membrane protein n=1 Tax=Rubrobacter xylanophilus TaxID=49319 RepID=A0A510HHH5_9ACTN|nr:EamA family transporter [Rubrobacter xylanophilus]BBL78715.1 membrane protein [Rubrobacter xylanophilus]
MLAVGSAAVLIRLSGAPALAVAFWRCALGAGLLLPVALVRRERFPRGRELRIGVASGVALGAHFGLWISSLDYTSVAASVVLVSTQPVFVAILAYLLFRERTPALSLAGILVAIVGTVLIAGDRSVGEAALLGNALALAGALAVAVYVLIGRSSRTGGLGALPYSVVVYSSAALVLLAAGLAGGVRMWGYPAETWLWLWAITLGPQLMGHTVFNWALRYVEASIVSGSILAEPVIAALLAWLVLAERPGWPTLVGGAVVLFGLALLLWGYRRAGSPGGSSHSP